MFDTEGELKRPTPPQAIPIRVVLAADPFSETLAYFTERLGFQIDVISPAEDPDRAVVSRNGLSVVLDRFASEAAGTGCLEVVTDSGDAGTTEVAPNGTRIQFTPATAPSCLPDLQPAVVVSRNESETAWVTGRAAMAYRDLIPDRQGGRFIASHINVIGSGPVADWVHHHDIRFQIIYCRSGAATLVYEDQGEPFRFEAGDCVLQPPGIRHRVIETFGDMEVIELGCPAHHNTYADHNMALPTGRHLPDRDYNGQRFIHFRAANAQPVSQPVEPWTSAGWEVVDTGIGDATNGLGSVRVVAAGAAPSIAVGPSVHSHELFFLYLLEGSVTLTVEETDHPLTADDSVVIPAGIPWSLVSHRDGQAQARLLEIEVQQL